MSGATVIPWDERAWIALRHFNDRDYFEAHDVWEEIWMEERGAVKLFYQGMIQAAVGCYKADFGVYNGAWRLLHRALNKFELAGAVETPFEFERFRADVSQFLARIEAAGPEGLGTIDPETYPLIWTSGEVLKDAVLHGGVVGED